MKFFVSSALLLSPFVMTRKNALVGANTGEDECTATYSVRLDANYPDAVAVKCTEDDMEMITAAIHAIVELDWIASKLGKSVPEFSLAYETFGEDVTVDATGLLATIPDAEEIVNHLTTEDLMEDLYYEGTSDIDESMLQLSETENNSTRKLSLPEEDSVEAGSEKWQLMEHSRRLPATMDCGLLGGCTAAWCCSICNHCRRRRRHLAEELLPEPQSLRTRTVTTVVEDATVDDEYLQRLEMFEERVSNELRKKLRYLARKETVPCLGNFWELEVYFKAIVNVEFSV
jgi:hypothetical protein